MKYLRFLLYPLAVAYNIITTVRNYLYDMNLVKSTRFQLPVIIIGNLSVGGTGKTPLIEYLVRLLKDKYKLAILSRGYKRKTDGFLLANDNSSVSDLGDEPFQFYNKFKNISIAVDKNRTNGIQKLLKLVNPEVVLLDDAFQHRKVLGSFYILLTTYNQLFINDFLLPTGNLRESRSGAYRADVIIVTKCPNDLSLIEQEQIKQKLVEYNQKVYFSSITYQSQLKGAFQINTSELKDYKVVLVTGIANPAPLESFLLKLGVEFYHFEFPDHHFFTSKDIAKINSKYKQITSSKKMILTTEKDFTRLQTKIKEVAYLSIEPVFLNQQDDNFDANILLHLKQFY